MIAGLISQVITMSCFLALWTDFAIQTRRTKVSGSFPRMQPALYELWNGFSGKLANHELTFMIFEGPLIIIAVAAITVFHPGRVFGDFWTPTGKGVTSTGKLAEDSDASVALTNTEWRDTAYHRVEQPGSVV